MKKKIIIALSIIVAVCLVVLGVNTLMPKTQVGSKSITIVIEDKMNNKELYSKTVRTDAEKLGDLLVEVKEVKAVFEDSTYGRLLVSLVDVAQKDPVTGPWWLYSSTKNESCLAAGMCMGVDDTPIKDGDDFTFVYTNTFN